MTELNSQISNPRCLNNGFIFNNGSLCYWTTRIKTNWINISAECRKGGGLLAIIPNSNVNQELINSGINSTLSEGTNLVWIGVRILRNEGRYVDTNGKDAEWTNWAQGQPSDPIPFSPPQDCVAVRVREELKWDDVSCSLFNYGLCYLNFSANASISTNTNVMTSYTATTETSFSTTAEANAATTSETNAATTSETNGVTTVETTYPGTTKTAMVITTMDSSRIIPVFAYCPRGVLVYTRSSVGARVEWQEVTPTVNSGNVTLVIQSKAVENGNVFNIGTTTVQYIASDSTSLLSQICEFNVTVRKVDVQCTDFPIIQNGNVNCGSRGGRVSCFIQSCDAGYLLLPGINRTYTCNEFIGWVPRIPPFLAISACFRPVPLVAYLSFTIVFRCSGNGQITANDVIDCLNNFNLCPPESSGIAICNSDQLNVTTNGNIVSVNAASMTNLGPGGNRANITRQLLEVNRNIVSFFNSSSNTVMCYPSSGCVLDNVTMSESPIFDCPVGSQQINYRGNITCALCSVGRYYSISTGICLKCGKGTYQDKPGLTFCLSCPRLRPLSKEASFRNQHCYATKTDSPLDIKLIIFTTLLTIIVIAILVVVFVQIFRKIRKRKLKSEEKELSIYEHYITVT